MNSFPIESLESDLIFNTVLSFAVRHETEAVTTCEPVNSVAWRPLRRTGPACPRPPGSAQRNGGSVFLLLQVPFEAADAPGAAPCRRSCGRNATQRIHNIHSKIGENGR